MALESLDETELFSVYEGAEITQEVLRIADLTDQQNFELINDENGCRLVYLMNDAAESFIFFENARINGTYNDEWEGTLTAALDRSGSSYMLIVHQGKDNVFTLTFDRMYTRTYLYDYGRTAHFWIPGYEKLRVTDYWLGIIKDKYSILGPDSCSETEKKLAVLAYFKPLRFFNSVPEKYMTENDYISMTTRESVSVLSEICDSSGDTELKARLSVYTDRQLRKTAKFLASADGARTLSAVFDMIQKAAAVYPERTHCKKNRLILEAAENKKSEMEKRGEKVLLLREEPFENTYDDMKFSVFLLSEKQDKNTVRYSVLKFE